MISRKLTMYAKNTSEVSVIRKFIEGMYSHPMYPDITAQLINTDGFVTKINTMIENKDCTEFISELKFENQQTFDNYFNDPSVQNLYNYLDVIIESENIQAKTEILQVDV